MQMQQQALQHLAVTALGTHQSQFANAVMELTAKYECNVLQARMTTMASECAIDFLVSGSWSAIAMLEGALRNLEKSLEIAIAMKRTEPKPQEGSHLAYSVHVTGLNTPTILHDITHFFTQLQIKIEELYSEVYTTMHTGTPMFVLGLSVSIPADTRLSELRERFMILCDELNVDAILEPEKK